MADFVVASYCVVICQSARRFATARFLLLFARRRAYSRAEAFVHPPHADIAPARNRRHEAFYAAQAGRAGLGLHTQMNVPSRSSKSSKASMLLNNLPCSVNPSHALIRFRHKRFRQSLSSKYIRMQFLCQCTICALKFFSGCRT